MRLSPLAVLILCACGGPGTFGGTVGGLPLMVNDAIVGMIKDGNGKGVGVALAMTDVADACTAVKANRNPKGSSRFQIVLAAGLSGNTPAVGEYAVGSFGFSGNNVAYFGQFIKNDPNCQNILSSQASGAKSGLVKLNTFTPMAGGGASGTFDITFGAQNDKVQGTFTARFCDGWNGTAPTSCE